MKDFRGKIAVVTGASTGMGRELALQLAREGCHVAFCDVAEEAMEATRRACLEAAPEGTRITSHLCDVSSEEQVNAFRAAVAEQQRTSHIHLLFNNAGVGGAIGFVDGDRREWDRVFDICWHGVYYCCRAFMPMLVASDGAYLVNTSSINGIWASLGPTIPHTAYSAAKFAVRGFSEALLTDLRLNAPHVKVAVVMPGHIGTDIALNVPKLLGRDADAAPKRLGQMRERLRRSGMPVDHLDDAQLVAVVEKRMTDFRNNAPMSAAAAATLILDGVREERWRILIGEDAKKIDRLVRERPESAYDADFFADLLKS